MYSWDFAVSGHFPYSKDLDVSPVSSIKPLYGFETKAGLVARKVSAFTIHNDSKLSLIFAIKGWCLRKSQAGSAWVKGGSSSLGFEPEV